MKKIRISAIIGTLIIMLVVVIMALPVNVELKGA
jgi:hypothetical protein